MLDEEKLLPLNFLSYGGIQTGDHKGMRYRMLRVGEKPDFQIEACVWPEPYCYDVTPEEEKQRAQFPFTEEGRKEAIGWMRARYEEERERWDQAPRLPGGS